VRCLLDTSVFLWALGPYEMLSQEVQDILDSGKHDLYLSAASSWEIAIKSSLNKLSLPEPAAQYIPNMLTTTGIRSLMISHVHALGVADLPSHHTDPFDRMLVAQAQQERMTLLTSDKEILKYDVRTMWSAR